MKYGNKTKKELINELTRLNRHIQTAETKNKQIVETLQESEERYKNFFENARAVIYTMTPDGKFLSVNPAFEAITGWSSSEWIGKQFTSVLHPDDVPAALDSFQRILNGEPLPFVELRILSKSGEYFTGEFKSFLQIQKGKVIGIQGIAHDITERKRSVKKLKKNQDQLEKLVAARTSELIKINKKLQREISKHKQTGKKLQYSLGKLKKSFEGTMEALSAAVEMRDPYTSGHQLRVALLACAIAREIGLPKEQVEGIRIAGQLHDIGKITVPTEILNKPGKLTEIEFNLIKIHSQSGYDILKKIDFPWQIAHIVLQHHEMMDGSGYPTGISRKNILMEARIITVADIVESMSSHRPYRPALGLDKALEEISKNRKIHLDHGVVDACVKLFAEKRFRFE